MYVWRTHSSHKYTISALNIKFEAGNHSTALNSRQPVTVSHEITVWTSPLMVFESSVLFSYTTIVKNDTICEIIGKFFVKQ